MFSVYINYHDCKLHGLYSCHTGHQMSLRYVAMKMTSVMIMMLTTTMAELA